MVVLELKQYSIYGLGCQQNWRQKPLLDADNLVNCLMKISMQGFWHRLSAKPRLKTFAKSWQSSQLYDKISMQGFWHRLSGLLASFVCRTKAKNPYRHWHSSQLFDKISMQGFWHWLSVKPKPKTLKILSRLT